jgi:hypothetical protein
LILAVKFLDDAQQSTREYVDVWGRGMWSCEQVNHTQWCLMDNLGGRLLPLWDEGVILGALEDMERAGRQIEPRVIEEQWDEIIYLDGLIIGDAKEREKGMSDGHAVIGMGEQLTPVETPLVENVTGTSVVSEGTRKAFSGSVGKVQEYFQLPDRSPSKEAFPAYVDPGRVLGF